MEIPGNLKGFNRLNKASQNGTLIGGSTPSPYEPAPSKLSKRAAHQMASAEFKKAMSEVEKRAPSVTLSQIDEFLEQEHFDAGVNDYVLESLKNSQSEFDEAFEVGHYGSDPEKCKGKLNNGVNILSVLDDFLNKHKKRDKFSKY